MRPPSTCPICILDNKGFYKAVLFLYDHHHCSGMKSAALQRMQGQLETETVDVKEYTRQLTSAALIVSRSDEKTYCEMMASVIKGTNELAERLVAKAEDKVKVEDKTYSNKSIAHPEDPNHLMGTALNHVIENVTTKRGETCKRIGNGTVAQCTLFKSSEYWTMYVEMPVAMVKAMSPLGRFNAAKEGCAKINENKKDKFESYTSNYLISDDGVVLNCTYRVVGK